MLIEDEWGHLECLYIKPAKHASITDGGLFPDTVSSLHVTHRRVLHT